MQAADKVHPLTKEVLEKYGYWQDSYYFKNLSDILDGKNSFDIVITLCLYANSNSPNFFKIYKSVAYWI